MFNLIRYKIFQISAPLLRRGRWSNIPSICNKVGNGWCLLCLNDGIGLVLNTNKYIHQLIAGWWIERRLDVVRQEIIPISQTLIKSMNSYSIKETTFWTIVGSICPTNNTSVVRAGFPSLNHILSQQSVYSKLCLKPYCVSNITIDYHHDF